jgi:hypothetical protein
MFLNFDIYDEKHFTDNISGHLFSFSFLDFCFWDLTIALSTFRTRFYSLQAEAEILLLQMMEQSF